MALVFLVVLISMVASTMAANWQANPNDCGKQYQGVNAMIIGGEPAEEYAWPWQVAMFEEGDPDPICGGSIVDPWWVISAAHCVNASFLCKPEVYSFRAGSISLTDDTDVTQERQASEIYVHPNYDLEEKAETENNDNDIALFRMKEPFILDEDYKVNTVCLPTGDMEDEFVVGQNATVTGWGTRQSGKDDYPDILHEVVVPIFNQTQCNQSYEGDITDNMICAGLDKGGRDACEGDSGGPLVAYPTSNYPNQYYLAGIVSFGEDCGNQSFTGVYTRVTRYEEWIRPIFNSNTPETYVPCACEQRQGMSSSTIAVIVLLSVLLAS